MSAPDSSRRDEVAEGDWKRELMNLLQLKGRVSSGKGRRKPISDRTLDAREAILFMCMKQVRSMGYDIRSIYSLRGKHIEALVARWKQEGVGAGAIQNRLSILRALSKWLGKDGMVLGTRHYGLDNPTRLRRPVAATVDKSWSAKGVDPEKVVAVVAELDPYVAMQLRLIDAFGLRREEAIQLKPNQHHQGAHLRVRDGTKGGRERMVSVASDKQRQVLQDAKQIVSRWDGAVAAPGRTLKQNLNRFDYVMRRLGLTKKGLGVTAHGLRHQRLNDIFEEVAGVPSPVRQMSGVPIIIKGDPVKWKQAQQKVSSEAGHGRTSISTAYTGSARSVKTPRLNWTAGLCGGGAITPVQNAPVGTPTITPPVQHIPQSTTDTAPSIRDAALDDAANSVAIVGDFPWAATAEDAGYESEADAMLTGKEATALGAPAPLKNGRVGEESVQYSTETPHHLE